MKVGVLALQGAVKEHMNCLTTLGVEAVAVKSKAQLEEVDGLILPGGESTTIGKLLRKYDMLESVKLCPGRGKPLFGTCAGLILLAKKIAGGEAPHLGLMNIEVARNAFGRQRESFETNLAIKGVAENFRAVFIRAPLITEVYEGVEVLAEHAGQIVAVQQGKTLLGTSFHPELTEDVRLHQYFVEMVAESLQERQKGEPCWT